MPSNPNHPVARTIRALRTYSGKSRAQVGRALGMSGGQIGRWERGEWKGEPPRPPMLQKIAEVTRIDELRVDLTALENADPAMRFGDAARREAERQRERPESEPGAPAGEDAVDEDP